MQHLKFEHDAVKIQKRNEHSLSRDEENAFDSLLSDSDEWQDEIVLTNDFCQWKNV